MEYLPTTWYPSRRASTLTRNDTVTAEQFIEFFLSTMVKKWIIILLFNFFSLQKYKIYHELKNEMKGRFLFAIKSFNFVSADIKIQLSQLICLDMRKAFDFNLFNRVVSLNQIQCFCFEEQRLNPGEEVKKRKTYWQNIRIF